MWILGDYVQSSTLKLFASCKRLETLACLIPYGATLDFANIGHLREVEIFRRNQNVMIATLALENLKLLESLTIEGRS